jgi:threonine/homoserine/homoserine lactone efflux protein
VPRTAAEYVFAAPSGVCFGPTGDAARVSSSLHCEIGTNVFGVGAGPACAIQPAPPAPRLTATAAPKAAHRDLPIEWSLVRLNMFFPRSRPSREAERAKRSCIREASLPSCVVRRFVAPLSCGRSFDEGMSMLLRAFGEMLPAALAIAFSPFPVIAVVLMLSTADAVRTGLSFLLGWLAGIGLLITLLLLAVSSADEAGSTESTMVGWVRVVAGAVMIVAAGKKWSTRPREGEEPVMPPWMARISEISPRRALRLGAVLGGANPKNIALAISAAASITELGLHGSTKVAAGVIFVVLASSTVLGAVAVRMVAGEKAAAPLDSVKGFMLVNNNVIMMFVFLLFGASVLGKGLEALSW